MRIRFVLLSIVWMVLVACEPKSEDMPTIVPTATLLPPTELPGQCATTTTYELRLTPPHESVYPYDGIPSPQEEWLARTHRETLTLIKQNSNLEITFSLPIDGGIRAEEQLLWSSDERWVALQYRFTLAKGEAQYYLGVYGVDGTAHETLAVTLDPLPFVWTTTGLAFTRQSRPEVFTLMFWNREAVTTLAENLSRPPFITSDGERTAIYSEHRVESLNLQDMSRTVMVENVEGLENLMWSPDRQSAALKFATDTGESLMMAFVDGREPITLRSGLSGLGNPLWSPDSQMLTFTQASNNQPIELHIVSVDGNDVWRFTHFPLEWSLGWFACD
jgi:hypothetical protein